MSKACGVSVLLVLLALGGGVEAGDTCQPDATTLCLAGSRFRVQVEWFDPADNDFTLRSAPAAGDGMATGVDMTTGYFTFPNERGQQNADLLVKVLNACPLNNRYWVFAASPSNLQMDITVFDTVAEQDKSYQNLAGKPFEAISDTGAFATCEEGASANTRGSEDRPTPNASRAGVRSAVMGTSAACVDGPETLCLQGGRFKIEAETNSFGERRRASRISVAGSDESGLFGYFNQDNLDLVVQLLDGRQHNGHFWFYLSNLAGTEYTVRVTDTLTGRARTYFQTLENAFGPATLENRAFGEVPDLLFPQFVVGDASADLGFDVELGLSNPNQSPLSVELDLKDATLEPVLDVEIETLFSEATGHLGGPSNGQIEIPGLSGVTATIRILPAPAVSVLRLVVGFLSIRTVNPVQEELLLAPAVTGFSYNLRESSNTVVDRIPVAATVGGRRFQFSASRRPGFETGIAVATPDGPATVEVEIFLDATALQGPGPSSLISSFFLAGQRSFFLEELFGEELPSQFESALVEIRSVAGASAFGEWAAFPSIAVTALDVLSPPTSANVQIAGKEVRRVE